MQNLEQCRHCAKNVHHGGLIISIDVIDKERGIMYKALFHHECFASLAGVEFMDLVSRECFR